VAFTIRNTRAVLNGSGYRARSVRACTRCASPLITLRGPRLRWLPCDLGTFGRGRTGERAPPSFSHDSVGSRACAIGTRRRASQRLSAHNAAVIAAAAMMRFMVCAPSIDAGTTLVALLRRRCPPISPAHRARAGATNTCCQGRPSAPTWIPLACREFRANPSRHFRPRRVSSIAFGNCAAASEKSDKKMQGLPLSRGCVDAYIDRIINSTMESNMTSPISNCTSRSGAIFAAGLFAFALAGPALAAPLFAPPFDTVTSGASDVLLLGSIALLVIAVAAKIVGDHPYGEPTPPEPDLRWWKRPPPDPQP
jgi:hypothetical protein